MFSDEDHGGRDEKLGSKVLGQVGIDSSRL